MTRPTDNLLKSACEELAATDPALARAYEDVGLPTWRDMPPAYLSLARSVVYQQISVKAAGSIWERLQATVSPLTPETILKKTEEELRGAGLSGPKIRHLRSIAKAISEGNLNLKALQRMNDGTEIRKQLVAVKGIGPWTAELFCLYALGDMDAFPTADLGLMESYKLLSKRETRPDRKEFEALGEAWRPWRGCAAHLLWDWLHLHRGG